MADLGTVSILVDVRGQPIVKDLAKDLNNVAAAEKQVSAATQKVMADFKRMQAITAMLKKTTDDTSNSFKRLSVQELQQASQNMQGFERALANTRRGMGQFGMATQQVGYQVGDFLVQVQSGTNAFVAFGQQATQLVGILPAFSRQLGLSVGTLIGISSGLGIAIPLITAIGAAFMRTGQEAEDSAKGVDTYKKALDGLQSSIGSVQEELNKLSFGTEDVAIASARKALVDLQAEIAKLKASQRTVRGGLILAPTAEERAAIDALVADYVAMVGHIRELENKQAALVEAQDMLNGGLSVAAGIQKGLVYDKEVELRLARQSAEETKLLEAGLSQAAIEGAKLAGLDLSNLSDAAMDVLMLATNMGIAVEAAANLRLEQGRLDRLNQNAGRGATSGRAIEFGTGPNAGKTVEEIRRLEAATRRAAGGARKLKEGLDEAAKAAEQLQKQLEAPLVNAVGSISDAFGDFVARGLRDFKGFVKSILGSFQNMIAQMIAMAVKNRIMLSLGIGGLTPGMAAAGQIAGIGNAGSMLGSFAGGGVAGSGLLGGFGAAMPSFLGGAGNGLFAVGANAAAAGGSIAATIGAVAAPLLAVAAVFSFFKKKTKELDSGLRITVGNMDALVETFRTVQTTRFFGLSKKVKTTVEEASAEVSDPVIKAIQDIQTQVIKAAEMFGIAESEFEDFVYKFDVSLKGLTDEQKIQKINEELLKMGDAFASLTGHFTSMNELLAAAQQRYDLQTRLLELQGDTEALLARQRELELAAVHDLNRSLLLQVHILEDYQIALNKTTQALEEANRVYEGALSDLRGAMARQLSEAQSALDSAKSVFDTALSNRYETLQNNLSSTEQALADAQQALAEAQRRAFEEGIQNRIAAVNASFNSLIAGLEARLDVAQRKAAASREVFEALDSALRDRRLASDAATFASRRSALSYVSSGGTDIDKLTSALGILNEPSEQFFGTFQDYARDFALTTNAIKENRDLAEATMTADEKTVMLLEQQIEQSRASQEAQVEALEKMLVVQEDFLTVSQAMEQLLAAQENYDQAKEAHDELLLQYPQLQETFISVGDALANYLAAQATYEQVQAQHAELVAQFPMLNESVLTVAQAVTNLQSAIAAQAAATAAQTAAQTALANAIAAANQAATTEAVPGFAVGGMHIGGPRIVGENGPELEVTGPSRIYSNRDTAAMFRDPNLASAVDGLRKEVSGMRSEQLQIQVEVSKNVKRIYDIERKWDTDGLPPERV